ncbi:hypothetical protein MBCUT_10890 [Methanobrevibacter cuticularis]|uniref:Uncharacterized protein n=1 Tax=Methanobrevibacter cuticularis TaxID=47311 RepID=A0A166DZD0_9EURY|nr:hypothetical protein [Methanobrevibacter cuticularis]KZX16112.1 hypothetical protein MBCUT_10890 [Methanobrevibacter cuticularis]
MNKEIKDLVVDKDVNCPLCGGYMKECGSKNGKTIFCCVSCGYKL